MRRCLHTCSCCEMEAGAWGAGSIFQDAQHEAGENSGVGPLPADINMVEPPRTRAYAPTQQFTNQSY
ncbi:jg26726 [Pararge aegeria aegeria]|uniref:Jg26726 protein n=1 Tax=Pararge aegeria aegeria TaxID=348720 RepID=A0A8S4QS66_9NEOP|nr:jg26726 [Pararge aegeria aegeria]